MLALKCFFSPVAQNSEVVMLFVGRSDLWLLRKDFSLTCSTIRVQTQGRAKQGSIDCRGAKLGVGGN